MGQASRYQADPRRSRPADGVRPGDSDCRAGAWYGGIGHLGPATIGMTCLCQAGRVGTAVPVPVRAVERVDGCGVAFAGYEAFTAALDQ